MKNLRVTIPSIVISQGTGRVRRRTWLRRWCTSRHRGQRASGPGATPHPPARRSENPLAGHQKWPKIGMTWRRILGKNHQTSVCYILLRCSMPCTMYAKVGKQIVSCSWSLGLWIQDDPSTTKLGLCWRYHVVVGQPATTGMILQACNPNDFWAQVPNCIWWGQVAQVGSGRLQVYFKPVYPPVDSRICR